MADARGKWLGQGFLEVRKANFGGKKITTSPQGKFKRSVTARIEIQW